MRKDWDKIIAEIKERVAAATPGPWKHDWGNWDVEGPNRENIADISSGYRYQEPDKSFHSKADPHDDAEFIAHARTDIPLLLERIEQLEDKCVDCGKDAVLCSVCAARRC